MNRILNSSFVIATSVMFDVPLRGTKSFDKVIVGDSVHFFSQCKNIALSRSLFLLFTKRFAITRSNSKFLVFALFKVVI